MNRNGIVISKKNHKIIDTLKIAQAISKNKLIEYKGHKLNYLLIGHNINYKGLHNAGNDAHFTFKYAEKANEVLNKEDNKRKNTLTIQDNSFNIITILN